MVFIFGVEKYKEYSLLRKKKVSFSHTKMWLVSWQLQQCKKEKLVIFGQRSRLQNVVSKEKFNRNEQSYLCDFHEKIIIVYIRFLVFQLILKSLIYIKKHPHRMCMGVSIYIEDVDRDTPGANAPDFVRSREKSTRYKR